MAVVFLKGNVFLEFRGKWEGVNKAETIALVPLSLPTHPVYIVPNSIVLGGGGIDFLDSDLICLIMRGFTMFFSV